MRRTLAALAVALFMLVPGAIAQDTSPAAASTFESAIAEARGNMMGDPVAALEAARTAETLASAPGRPAEFDDQTALATAWWHRTLPPGGGTLQFLSQQACHRWR